ncbi:aminopeptidase P family protein [Haloplasma contractile]|uniref:Xaa-Pro aminopeptidase n=1 Tax=Haloplasma contractile SSD-17B TaxID=1033810 RepID=U2EE64_9MOLU|nr:aminopeptidase P family protein [Haloplasma contractile]ERJ12996.1 Xaa-Pro aminopeptidase protein [Haloplasma contractile SSD-17B]
MNRELFVKNRNKFAQEMEDKSIAVFFAGKAPNRSADQNYEFTPNRNFYYLTGIDRENMILIITKYQNRIEERLFIEQVSELEEKWTGIRLKQEAAESISGIKKIMPTNEFEKMFERTLKLNNMETIYLDTEYRGNRYQSEALAFSKTVQTNYPHLAIRSATYIVHDLRTIKEPEEIEEIRKAIDLTRLGIESLMNNSEPGLKENQLEAFFDFAIKYHGSKSRAFETIAAGGKNATILHYNENNQELKDGDLILFDLGAEHSYYCADISRTIPVNGKFTARQKAIYESVLSVQEECIKFIKPGILWKDLHQLAKDLLAKEAIKLGIIQEEKDIMKYYYHGIGHYMGLDVHDVGRYDFNQRPLQAGMVLTIEPGLYIEEEGIGVRIEEDVLVTEDGYEVLSKDIIKTVDDIESFMSK